MDIGLFLLVLGLVSAIPAGWVALNARGSATALERWAETNAELHRHAQGDLGPATRSMSAGVYRCLGTAVGLSGTVLALAGLAILL
ncbi:hypothetical protein [Streptomyces sp. H27-S2]|uniref:hypothetical protein n=1 Tax=Streptomyces antarcticus TaxID=2996458 RepID=UPI00226F7BE4|nr:hypothetical protein [Streptomyces sp. H27-S2]MCY0953191.1 hypothetical protein [Streptomyces sp. H27-S2]